MQRPRLRWILLAIAMVLSAVVLFAQVKPAPDREEGEGPFDRLIIRGATLIDGTGAPPIGPVDIVVENDKIVDVRTVGYPKLPINENRRPKDATKEIDAHGKYVMPGIVDLHAHTGGSSKAPEAEYVYKLWLGHGITTVLHYISKIEGLDYYFVLRDMFICN